MTAATASPVVVVGASLAGLTVADTLRAAGYTGELTLVGDEPHEPYDRPPLSKAVLAGRLPADHTLLPSRSDLDAGWLLGQPATALDVAARTVRLGDGRSVPFGTLLITTGTAARQWPADLGGDLAGVLTLRTRDDAERLRAAIDAGPRRVLVVGAGFTGSEVASSLRECGLEVTVVDRGPAPLTSALGETVGQFMAARQRAAGIDLRSRTTVLGFDGDTHGRLRRARLSDGSTVEADLAVIALGAVRDTGWLSAAGLAADGRGVDCDGTGRVRAADGSVLEHVYAAGDVARWPSTDDGQLVSLEHWGNAVEQARIAAHAVLGLQAEPGSRRPPSFWSDQFGLSIKAVGTPHDADRVLIAEGSLERARFVAVYGRAGRTVAAVAVDNPRAVVGWAQLVAEQAPFPPPFTSPDAPVGG